MVNDGDQYAGGTTVRTRKLIWALSRVCDSAIIIGESMVNRCY